MSLRDQSCYTLELQQSATDPSIVELVEVVGVKREPRYARVKEHRAEGGEVYSAAVYDYLNGAKLASTGHGAEKGSKQRRLQLHGPDEDVPFDLTAKLTFEWTFLFGENKFRWTREIYGKDYICSLDRKPDPKVEICLARGPDKNEAGRIQILHYNLERFPNEITDLRGLETLLITTFMSFVDASEERSVRPHAIPAAGSGKISPTSPGLGATSSLLGSGGVKPKAEEKFISEDDFEPESPNEIRVGRQSDVDERIARAVGLLMDPSVLFVIIRTTEPSTAQKALQVALGVTRFRHREGLGDLHQYVVEQTEPDPTPPLPAKGPKVIKLDDPVPQPQPPKYVSTIQKTTADNRRPSPPATALNIAIYLSTIQLPDLAPKAKPSASGPSNGQASRPPAKEAPKSNGSSKPVPPKQPSPNPTAPSRPPPPPATSLRPTPAANPPRPPQHPPAPPHRPDVSPSAPPPPAPPRPPPPNSAEGKGKESVVKKLIAMSRR